VKIGAGENKITAYKIGHFEVAQMNIDELIKKQKVDMLQDEQRIKGRLLQIDHEMNHAFKLKDADSSQLSGYSIESSLLKNQALTNFSPGVQFINDKGFGLFVDDLIRFYLKEAPILESIPARSFAFRNQKGKWLLDRVALKNAAKNKDRFVIKRVDEDGGSGVWIGHKHTRKAFEKVVDSVRNDPEKYIFQEFEHLSVLENRIVDLRIHAHVDSDDIIVSNNPWGRANWVHNDGKVNLGSNGFISPVVIVP